MPRDNFGDVLSDTPFFLRESAAVNDRTFRGPCLGNFANFHVGVAWGGDNGGVSKDGQGEFWARFSLVAHLSSAGEKRQMVTFEILQETDIPLVQDLARRIWSKSYEDIITREQMEYMLEWMYSVEAIRSDLDKGVWWEVVRVWHQTVWLSLLNLQRGWSGQAE